MATRTILTYEDPFLRKISRKIDAITPRIQILAQDMIQTMRKASGAGLAAPQVGILRRIFVIETQKGAMTFINPEILSTEGEQRVMEGCLSVPGKIGWIIRPQKVTVRAFDIDGKEFIYKAQDFYAKAVCHEYDHLDGILYTDKMERFASEDELD